MTKPIDKQKQGRTNRKKGMKFEVLVRKSLEAEGWIVTKWLNQINLITGLVEPAKQKFNPFTKRIMAIGTGMPDFLAFRNVDSGIVCENKYVKMQEVIGVESKSNGRLDPEEKDKCRLYLKNNIFKRILIARKKIIKGKITVLFEDFEDKYEKKEKEKIKACK